MRTILIIVLILVNIKAQSQEYSMYWNGYSLFNPAASGLHQKYYGALMARKQWLGMNDSPFIGDVIIDMKADVLHGGAGMNYGFDNLGPLKNHTFNANYNYQINLENEKKISLGVSAGIDFKKLEISQIILSPLMNYDPMVESSYENFTNLNVKFGVFYKSNHLDIGISSSHYKNIDSKNKLYLSNNNWFVSAYRFDIRKDLSLRPNLLIQTKNFQRYSFSGCLLMMFNHMFWTGISYKYDSSYGIMAGIDLWRMVRLGYSVDIPTSSIRHYGYGNHEIVLALMLN